MRKKLSKFIQKWDNNISIQQLIHWSGQSLIMPFYHTIQGKESLPHVQHLYPLRSVKQFEKDLDFFCQHFQAIDLSDLISFVKNGKTLPEKAFFLSFDDGLKEIDTIIAPILKRKGIPATIFLNSDFVDNKALFFRYKASLLVNHIHQQVPSKKQLEKLLLRLASFNFPKQDLKSTLLKISYQNREILDEVADVLAFDFSDFLNQQKPYLTSTQIQKLQLEGFTFGGHSTDHPLYAHISEEEQIRQTVASVDFVQQNFKINYRSFAFPFTDDGVNISFFKKIGSNQNLDISFGCAGLKEQTFPFHFQRIPIELSEASAAVQIKTEMTYFLMKKLLGKNKVKYEVRTK